MTIFDLRKFFHCDRIQERLNARAGNGSAPTVEVLERGFNGFHQVRCLRTMSGLPW